MGSLLHTGSIGIQDPDGIRECTYMYLQTFSLHKEVDHIYSFIKKKKTYLREDLFKNT